MSGTLPDGLEDRLFRARTKLAALTFLLSEMEVESSANSEVFHGLGMVLDDIHDALTTQPVGSDAENPGVAS